jgi:hypothetical protein
MRLATLEARLRKAAEIIRERGLARRVLVDSSERVCMLGAWNVANTGSATDTCDWEPLREAMRPVLGDKMGIPSFNDRHCASADDAAAAFEIAADLVNCRRRDRT